MYIEVRDNSYFKNKVFLSLYKNKFDLLGFNYRCKYHHHIALTVNADMMVRRLLPLCIKKPEDDNGGLFYDNVYIFKTNCTKSIFLLLNKKYTNKQWFNIFHSIIKNNNSLINTLFTNFNFEKVKTIKKFKKRLSHYIRTFMSIRLKGVF